MQYIKQFSEFSKDDVATAGGKGASLGEMTRLFGGQAQVGIPVPPGFVLLASAFDAFLAEADMGVEIAAVLDTVNTAEMHTVEHASEKIQALILNASMPLGIADEIMSAHTQLGAEFVAVRSSATAEDSASAAWAGQLDSFLNTTKETLLQNVQKCWASLFTPRAIFYRFEKKLHTQQVSVAVVVQTMVQSEISGIAFSVHPVTQDRNQLIIEAGYGLGEAIVSGQITPDSYVVTKNPLEIIDKNISTQDRMLIRSANGGSGWVSCSPPQEGELGGVIENSVVADVTATSPNPSSRGGGESTMPQKLSDIQIFELSRLIVQIENHYGFPCDIEWAWANGQFYITQSRPITTLQNPLNKDGKCLRFVRSYSRDCSILLEQAWYKAQMEGMSEVIGTINPYGPVNCYYVHNGLLEIWENKDAVAWAGAELLVKVLSGEYSVDDCIQRYAQLYQKLEKTWKQDVVSAEEFFDCCDTFFDATKLFARIFYLAVSPIAPDNVRAKVLAVRQNDNLMDGMDTFIRTNIHAISSTFIDYATVVLYEEMKQLQKVSTQLLETRKEHWVIVPGLRNFIGTLSGLAAAHPEYFFEDAAGSEVDEKQHLAGSVAVEGYAKGRVVLVNRKVDVNNVASGDILVSRMTIPDFVPAMKLAAAIVTDEGGVTCHAAIIARELNKPCIIGTKIATRVLRAGDLVEVDATNGVVRVLERAALSSCKKIDYELSFKAKGMSVLLTDMCVPMFDILDPLLLLKGGSEYYQYFHKTKLSKALEEGVQLYGNYEAFANFQNKVHMAQSKLRNIYDTQLVPKRPITHSFLNEAFDVFIELNILYGKMNVEFTDKAYELRNTNPVIKEILQKLSLYKDEVRAFMNKALFESDSYFSLLLFNISEQYSVSLSDLQAYTVDELVRIPDGFRIAPELGATRLRAYVVRSMDSQVHRYQGSTAQDFIDAFVAEQIVDARAVRGQVACSGSTIGRVKLIPVDYGNFPAMRRAMEAMNDGDILVAETTAPELMEACRKASAIITDLGGMMSHAAIVSRELNIPCIVGTKVATQVLHDGDLVEVGADSGVVRILEKAK